MPGYYDTMPEPDAYMESGLSVFLIVMIVIYGLIFLISLIPYIFHSIGLYSIANRRGIKHPWMAWVPLLQLWILGSISDQYQYVVKGKVHNRRKTLIGLDLGVIATLVAMVALCVNIVAKAIAAAEGDMGAMEGLDLALDMINTLRGMYALYFVFMVVAVIAAVFQYVSYFDLFASCNPDKAPTLLVVSMLLSFTLPFVVFFNRKKDLGMPPKKSRQAIEEAPQAEQEPVAQEPVAEAAEVPEEESAE